MAASTRIDPAALRFTSPTPGMLIKDPVSGIISTCLFGSFDREWATARIDGLEFDTLLLSRGSNYPSHGVLGGEAFKLAPHSIPLISYIPQGVRGEVTYFREPNTASLLMFPPGRLASMMPDGDHSATKSFAMVDNEKLVELFQMIETEILAPDHDRPGQIDTLIHMLAHYLADRSVERRPRQRPHLDISPAKLKRVLNYMDDHLAEPIDVSTMAEVVGLSRFHFVRVFKSATGRSPYQHLLHRRVARAQSMIAGGAFSLTAISKTTGFTSPTHFSTCFKRETGMTPSCYRELVQRRIDESFISASL